MSKPWGGITSIGSWAAEAELADAEEREKMSSTTTTTTTTQSFPSRKESITTKPKKKKMTLSEFNTFTTTSKPSFSLSSDQILRLPTAPQPRSDDDHFSGGFSSRRRGFDDDDRRPPRREFEPQMPSRADEVDNWASEKRAMPVSNSGRSSGSSRVSSLGGGGSSRADDVDNWNMGKRVSQIPPPTARSSSFGSGFRDLGSGGWRGERESRVEPALVIEKTMDRPKSNPFEAARPREEVLAEKGLDWKKIDLEIEEKKGSSRPTSEQGSRPTSSSSQSNRSESLGVGGSEGGVKQRPKVNPFGDAKPREVLLQEKGMDWRKIDLELERRRIDRPETDDEKALKEEIEKLKKEIEKESGNDASQGSGGEETNLRDLVEKKEKDLEALIRELNDKVRFGQKPAERPGSGAGRFTSFSERERPPSRSGSFEDSRGPEPMERPRSRGKVDVWTRSGPFEDRRGGFLGSRDRGGFQGSRDRGFLSNRDSDRFRSRERW